MDEVNNPSPIGSVPEPNVSPVPVSTPKKGMNKMLLLPVVAIVLLMCVCVGTLVIGFFSNKNIPVVSDVVEKIERLALSDEAEAKIVQEDMVNTMMNVVYNVALDDSESTGLVGFTKAEVEDMIAEELYMESAKYEANVKADVSGVVVNIDASGVINSEESNPGMSMILDGSLSTQGVTLDLAAEMRSVDEQAYLQVTKLPAIPELAQLGLDAKSLQGQWFSMPLESTEGLVANTASQTLPGDTDDPMTVEDLKKIKNFLESDTVNKTITRINDEVHDGVRTNCFRMTLDSENIEAVLNQAAEDFGGEKISASELAQLQAVFKEIQLEICKGRRDGQIYRIDLSASMYDQAGEKMDLSFSLKMSEFGKDHNVEKPSNAVPFEQFLMQGSSGADPFSGTQETDYTDEELEELLRQYESGEYDF